MLFTYHVYAIFRHKQRLARGSIISIIIRMHAIVQGNVILSTMLAEQRGMFAWMFPDLYHTGPASLPLWNLHKYFIPLQALWSNICFIRDFSVNLQDKEVLSAFFEETILLFMMYMKFVIMCLQWFKACPVLVCEKCKYSWHEN